MYHIINIYADSIISSISANHINDYDWLQENKHRINDSEYQRKYKAFWSLNAARLSDSFCEYYFELFEETINNNLNIEEVTEKLYCKHTHKERKSLQFSFASKLLHMTNSKLPIYDSMISDFYFFRERNGNKSLKERLPDLSNFYLFLNTEYDRILNDGLLELAINKFRGALLPKFFSDQKVIDSLLWAFLSMQKGHGLSDKKMLYC